MQDKEAAILKVTESMIRDGGYNSFSFRSIADAVGIKSSSVH
jgi:TetR/AcrR family transcriptional repressor of nem operon